MIPLALQRFMMPNIIPLLSAALETSANCPGPPSKTPLAVFAIIACGASLGSIHIVESRNQELARRRAHYKEQSVEDFRAQEIRRIDRYRNPYRRFFARRYLETECESLSLWQNYDRRVGGEAEVQVYRLVKVASDWEKAGKGVTTYLQWLTQAVPKGPSHLYTLIREEALTSFD